MLATGTVVVVKKVDIPDLVTQTKKAISQTFQSVTTTFQEQNQESVTSNQEEQIITTIINETTPYPPPTGSPNIVHEILPQQIIIKCLGADGLYSYVSKELCEAVDKYWDEHPAPSNVTASSTTSTASSSSSSDPTPTPTPACPLGDSGDLSGLAVSGSPGNYSFVGNTYDYSGVTVLNAVNAITVTPTGSGTITVDGAEVLSGEASASISLTSGVEKTITVITTETCKTAKTYTINITRSAQVITDAITPGTVVEDSSIGTGSWTNINNSILSDNSYATTTASTFSGPVTVISRYIKATNFGFSIPVNSTINGIVVEVERKSSANSSSNYSRDNAVSIVKNNTISSTNIADTTNKWPTSDTYKTYGASDNLWGETWTASDINASNFGVAFSVLTHAYTMSAPCLDKDTLIRTEDGLTKIKDLKIGQKIISYNTKLKRLEKDEITNVTYQPIIFAESKFLKIYTNNGDVIKATPNHKFYSNGKWVEARNLRQGSVLLNNKLEPVVIKNIEEEINFSELVWDITVKNNNNFFAENTLVHNAVTITSSVDSIRITVYYTN